MRGLRPAPKRLLHGQVLPTQCPPGDRDGVPGSLRGPRCGRAGSVQAAVVRCCATQSAAQLRPPFQLGGWLPSRAAAEPCPARPWLRPPSVSGSSCLQLCLVRGRETDSPGAVHGRQGAFGDCALLCPSLGKLNIQLKSRACCRAACVLELWVGAAFPCFQFVVLGQGGHGRTAVGRALEEREAEGNGRCWADFFPPTPQDSQAKNNPSPHAMHGNKGD